MTLKCWPLPRMKGWTHFLRVMETLGTSVIQQKGPFKDSPHVKREIPLYHRSGDKPLDPTSLTETLGGSP